MRIIAPFLAASFGALTFHLGSLSFGAAYEATATLALDEARLAFVRADEVDVQSLLARDVSLSFPDATPVVRIHATGPSPEAAEHAAIAAGRVIALRLERAEREAFDRLKAELTRAFGAPEESYRPLTAAEVIARNRG